MYWNLYTNGKHGALGLKTYCTAKGSAGINQDTAAILKSFI